MMSYVRSYIRSYPSRMFDIQEVVNLRHCRYDISVVGFDHHDDHIMIVGQVDLRNRIKYIQYSISLEIYYDILYTILLVQKYMHLESFSPGQDQAKSYVQVLTSTSNNQYVPVHAGKRQCMNFTSVHGCTY
jgi:hypothetical protein